MGFAHILQAINSTPLAILPAKMAAIMEVLARRSAGVRLSAEEIAAAIGPRGEKPTPRLVAANGVRHSENATPGAVAVLPIHGTLCNRIGGVNDGSGGIAAERVQSWVAEAAANPDVGSILLDIDSPGGDVQGIAALANEIFAARKTKRVVAVVNALAASAGYWIAAQADEIVVTADGEVGSIGVWCMHQDLSGKLEKEGVDVSLIFAGDHKVDGNPFEPLSDEFRAELQQLVDRAHATFIKAVARGRGASVSTVREEFGGGRVFEADQAIARGMADRVGTLSGVIAELTGGNTTRGRRGKGRRAADLDLRRRRMEIDGVAATL